MFMVSMAMVVLLDQPLGPRFLLGVFLANGIHPWPRDCRLLCDIRFSRLFPNLCNCPRIISRKFVFNDRQIAHVLDPIGIFGEARRYKSE